MKTPFSPAEELEVRVNLALMKLERTCYQLKLMQEDLSSFLEDYFARVGGHVSQLHDDIEVHSAPVPAEQPTHEEVLEEAREGTQELQDECKKLYRDLARHYHPDTGTGSTAAHRTEIMSRINHAYRRKELGTLIRLSTETFREEVFSTDDETRHALEARFVELKRLTELTEISIAQLRETPEYQLKMRVQAASACGVDAIQSIIDQVDNQLSFSRGRDKKLA